MRPSRRTQFEGGMSGVLRQRQEATRCHYRFGSANCR